MVAQHHNKAKRDILKTLNFSLEKFCFVHSFMELVKKLLTLKGEKYFLSDKLIQESLEEHFGRQCTYFGASDNPLLQKYTQSKKKIFAKLKLIRVRGMRWKID